MEPLDRVNEQFRRIAAAMRTATVRQRSENDEQRVRVQEMRQANLELRERARLDDIGVAGR